MVINSVEDLEKACRTIQAQGKRVVFTNGVFDLMHIGHLRYLTAARALGDALVVAVNTDSSVQRLKGPARPIVGQNDRQEMLDGLRCVDYVTAFDTDTPVPLVTRLKPDIYAKGGDYIAERLPEAPVVHSYGGQVVILPFVDGRSSSGLIARILAGGFESS